MVAASISKIVIYPIKSCAGIELESAEHGPGGLRFDRRWMLVDSHGAFLSQRTHPQFAGIQTMLFDRERRPWNASSETPVHFLGVFMSSDGSLSSPELLSVELLEKAGGLLLPLEVKDGPSCQVEVWNDQVRALEYSPGSDWFRAHFDQDLRLVYLPEKELRQVNPHRSRPGDRVGFADGYPLLLVNGASLDSLNSMIAGGVDAAQRSKISPLSWERFRPNLILEGLPAWDEETWREIKIAEFMADVPKLCERCVVTTIDPTSRQKGPEPLKTLAREKKWQGALWFGANLILRGDGVISLGSPVEVIRRRPHPALAARP
ncbi:MAG: MOSC domain-containing protein [Polyangiaceae bacterium]|nr:MOSC domain-containing protein [Polyangiaceae bacterium]